MKKKLVRNAVRIFVFSLLLLGATGARAQWQILNNSIEGSVGAMLVTDTDLIVANASGVYRSTDNGGNWIALDLQFSQDYPAYSLARVGGSTSSPMIFAGTDGGGVYRTTNEGANWSKLDSGLGGANVIALVAEGTILFAGTDGGVFLSSDSGAFWHRADTGLPRGYGIEAMTVVNSVLLAATEDGLYRSTDAGKTWLSANTDLGADSSSVVSFSALDTNGSSTLFAGTPDGAYRSTDNGASWISAIGNLPANSYFNAIVASDGNLFMSSNGYGVYSSMDQGATWIAVNTSLSDLTIFNLAANDSFLFAGAFDGLWRRPLSDFSTSAVMHVASIGNSLTSYPNPFTQSTTINFTTSESGIAEVSVVNILGTEVARIFSGELSAGEHSFTYDGNGLAAGVYECLVQMNGSVQRVAVVLTR